MKMMHTLLLWFLWRKFSVSWALSPIMLLLTGLSTCKKFDESKDSNSSKKTPKPTNDITKSKRQISSTEVFGVSESPTILAAAPVSTSVSLEPNPVILRQEVPRFITRTITRDVPVSVPVPYAVRTPVVVPVDRPVAVPVVQKVPFEVTKHVPVYYETKVPYPVKVHVHVPVPYPVTVEKHVPVDRPVYVDRPVPHPIYIDRQVPVERPLSLTQSVFINRPVPQQIVLGRAPQSVPASLPQFLSSLPNFPDIPFGMTLQ